MLETLRPRLTLSGIPGLEQGNNGKQSAGRSRWEILETLRRRSALNGIPGPEQVSSGQQSAGRSRVTLSVGSTSIKPRKDFRAVSRSPPKTCPRRPASRLYVRRRRLQSRSLLRVPREILPLRTQVPRGSQAPPGGHSRRHRGVPRGVLPSADTVARRSTTRLRSRHVRPTSQLFLLRR